MKPQIGDIWKYTHLGSSAIVLLLKRTYPDYPEQNKFLCRLLWQSEKDWWRELDHWSVGEHYNRDSWEFLA